MNCEELKFNINLLFDHKTTGAMKEEIEQHLRMCNTCSIEFNKLKHYFQKLEANAPGIHVPQQLIDELVEEISSGVSAPEEIKEIPVETEIVKKQAVIKEKREKREKKPKEPKNPSVLKKDDPLSNDIFLYFSIIVISLLIIAYFILRFFIK